MTTLVLLGIFAYLIGSIPTGFLVFKLKEKKDIRDFGSRNIGATNILRVKGWPWALMVLVLDVAKGLIPALIGRSYLHPPFVALAVSFLAVVGHCFPFTLRFRGGKGVATSVGVMAVFGWPALLFSAGVFGLAVFITRFVSLGSLLASLAFVPLLFLFTHDVYLTIVASLFTLLIWVRHQANLRRLAKGTESRLGQKAEPSKSKEN